MMTDSPFDWRLDSVCDHVPVPGARLWPIMVVPALIVALTFSFACHAHPTKPQNGFEATLPTDTATPPLAGAIFNVHTGYAALVEGPRAHLVGDLLTINLVENLNTSKQAIGKTTKSGGFSVTPPKAGPFVINPNALSASGASQFSGEGDASEKSQLGGQISVTIAETRHNGTVLVKGTKRLLLSQGEQWVQLSGIVRLADIDQNNTIQSGQVADAHVVYTGNGAIGRSSRMGWLGKLFSIVNPF